MGIKTKPLPVEYGHVKVLQKISNYEFAVEFWLMRENVNRNNWSYKNLDKYYLTFVGRPILIAYVNGKVGDGHNYRVRHDPKTGEEYNSYTDATAERIVGTLSDDPADFALVERDGDMWIKAKGKLFAFYNKELTDYIVQAGSMDVSVETLVSKSYKDGKVEVMTEWEGLAVTILGNGVNPAIPGASIAKLAAMQEEFKELKLRAASLHTAAEGSDGNEPDKNTKKGVKSNMNKRAMEQMQTKFPNHKVLSMSEDGLNVALLDASGNLFGYTFNADDNGEVIASKIMPCAAHIVLSVGEVELNADVADVVDYTVASVKETDGDVKSLNAKLEAANEQISAMQEAESKRRLSACKASAKATLDAFNANREEKVAEDAIKAVNENIEAGLYANSCDKDGAWLGEKLVREAVLAVCGEAVMESDKRSAQKRKTTYAWEHIAGNSGEGSEGVDALLNKWGIDAGK